MKKKYMLRRLFIVAFAMVALYSVKIGRIGIGFGVEVDPTPTIGEIPSPTTLYHVDEVPAPPTLQPEMEAVAPNEPVVATDSNKAEADALSSADITGELEKDPSALPGDLSPAQETMAIYGRKPRKQEKVKEERESLPKDVVAAVAKEDTFDPTAAIADWYAEGAGRVRRSVVEIMGVKIDLAEIDLIVETEVLAGTIRTKDEILDYRRYIIGQKVVEKRAALAQQLDRSRNPSSVKKSSL